MARNSGTGAAGAALLLTAAVTSAQVFFAPYDVTFFQDRIGLIQKDQVRQELKLEPEQSAKLDAALRPIKEKYQKEVDELQKLPVDEAKKQYEKCRTAVRGESLKAIEAALRPEQRKRLDQIELQQRGPKAFDDPDVQIALGLREEQKSRIKALADEARQEEDRALRTTGLTFETVQRIRRRQLEKTVAVLTEEQQKTWQELVRAPFALRVGPQ